MRREDSDILRLMLSFLRESSTIHCKLTGKKRRQTTKKIVIQRRDVLFEKPPICKYFSLEALCISAFCFAEGTEKSRAFLFSCDDAQSQLRWKGKKAMSWAKQHNLRCEKLQQLRRLWYENLLWAIASALLIFKWKSQDWVMSIFLLTKIMPYRVEKEVFSIIK